MSRSWYDSPWRIAVNALGLGLTLLLVALACGVFLVPRLLGGTSLTVLTGSMEPGLVPGDVVAVRGIDEDDVCSRVSVGDIVTYLPEPGKPDLITHRVVGKTIGTYKDGTDCRLVTQGDANSAADKPVSPAQVRGTFLYGIPKIGWARQWVTDHRGLALGGAVALVLAYGAWDTVRPPRRRLVAMPGGAGAAVLPATPAPPPAPAPDDALRVRELDLREREVAVREAELALRTRPSLSEES
jgi:signal peptidase I